MKNYQITSWVHHFLEDHVQQGDICIDATMGNGNDTALLSKLAIREKITQGRTSTRYVQSKP